MADVRKRTTLKGSLTRLKTNLDGLDENTVDLGTVVAMRERLQKLESEIIANHNDLITASADQAEADVHQAIHEATEQRLDDMVAKLTNLGEKIKARTPASTTQPAAKPEYHLPKMELPTFTGDVQKWQSFHDLFTSMVHNNNVLAPAQKLQYLKLALKGDAGRLIDTVAVTDANYQGAWDALTDRYANERVIVFAQIQRLFEQPVMQQETASQLRKLIDTTSEALRSLENLKRDTKHWDDLLVYLLLQKLDPETRRRWELQITGTSVPKFDDLMKFLTQQAIALDTLSSAKIKLKTTFDPKGQVKSDGKNNAAKAHQVTASTSFKCPFCDQKHSVYKCEEFKSKSVAERIKSAKEANLCFNCLRKGHSAVNCTSSNCRICNNKHNTMLHVESTQPAEVNHSQVQSLLSSSPAQVLLGTAVVRVQDGNGNQQECRVLIDPGSQATLISSSCVNRLGLNRERTNIVISGVTSVEVATASYQTTLQISSRYDNAKATTVEAVVLNKVTSDMPCVPFKKDSWPHLNNLKLADPEFHQPRKIDILLGADIYSELLLENIVRGDEGSPIAQNTKLGWVVFGPTATTTSNKAIVNHVQCSLDTALEKFWNLEEVSAERVKTTEERECEEHFQRTCLRNQDGSYTVEMPFKCDPVTNLGDSKVIAMRRFYQLERRLNSNSKLKSQYSEFIQEFLDSKHMEEIPATEVNMPVGHIFYLPHHCVTKEASTTTKLRVVFDGSAKTSTGKSLNELLMVGPVLQDELFDILVRYRSYAIPMVADLKQMFRHIWLHPKDRDYLRILWRFEKGEPVKEYRCKTVTYGTACATYLATKVLQRLADDEELRYPLAAKKLREDFYVDDLMSGANSVSEALELQKQMLEVMQAGKLVLRKWSSSYPELLEKLPPELCETKLPLDIEQNDSIKTLGMKWYPSKDYFAFEVKSFGSGRATKRTVLSDIAKVFDPLGLLSPVTIQAKVFMQSLWQTQIGWDAELTESLIGQWMQYRNQLSTIESIQIPRFVLQSDPGNIEIHGFSDASEKAYAAVVYVRAKSSSGLITCNLVASKTKVAPLKKISVPRLELCGAVVLTKLIQKVAKAFKMQSVKQICWTDSTVVRDWIYSPPHRWQTFVANRVTKIQNELKAEQWHHISGKINPADIASRGISSSELVNHELWWHGPAFLRQPDYSEYLSSPPNCKTEPMHEERKAAVHVTSAHSSILESYSSLQKLKRHSVIFQRFICYLRKGPLQEIKAPIEVSDMDQVLLCWIKAEQSIFYKTEKNALKAKTPISSKSKILPLAPFLDEDGFIRVGGRLHKAQLPFNRKHPLLLSPKSHLTKLIIQHIHERQFHAGNQLTLYTIQQRYWIPRGKETVRGIIKKCISCFRFSHHQNDQLMGDLPLARLTPSIPFHKTGVDYGGPYIVRLMKGRSNKTFKAYVALFVCFATRAIHLELVSDLTTNAFLAALKRFVSRRGRPSEIFSDNGSNFVGADRELKEFLKIVSSEETNAAAKRMLQEDGIKWTFNPPAAPHMGGLWEAGIKSTKFHLKRVMGTASLTYEELETILIQVEAILNSRPLCPNTADPNELAALTPGHFLIGAPINALPEPDYTHLKENRLSRWQLVQQKVQHFWRRWSQEYLARLQQRPKWLNARENLVVGDIVLLKDEQQSPQRWRLGKIEEIHPGADGIVRVVTVKTADGIYKRPVTKLSRLPLDPPEDPPTKVNPEEL